MEIEGTVIEATLGDTSIAGKEVMVDTENRRTRTEDYDFWLRFIAKNTSVRGEISPLVAHIIFVTQK